MTSRPLHRAAPPDPSTTPGMDAGALQAHMAGTYFALRRGMGIIALVLPFLLWLGGLLADGEPLRSSMSAYYYSPAMRNWFVGALVAIGAFLYLYQGFSRAENRALNLAGLCAVGIAMIPTANGPGPDGGAPRVHGAIAVLFFASIAYVCIFRASDTLSLIRNGDTAERYRRIYRLFGLGMIVLPLVAVALAAIVGGAARWPAVFVVEALAVELFAAFWLTKSAEMQATDAERLALAGKIKRASTKPIATPGAGRLVQVAPDDPEAAATTG